MASLVSHPSLRGFHAKPGRSAVTYETYCPPVDRRYSFFPFSSFILVLPDSLARPNRQYLVTSDGRSDSKFEPGISSMSVFARKFLSLDFLPSIMGTRQLKGKEVQIQSSPYAMVHLSEIEVQELSWT
jgi:hypothetical protein